MFVKGIEKVTNNRKLIAVVFRKNIPVDGVKFLTEDKNPIQIGIHKRQEGVSLSPHVHVLKKPLVIKTIQEVLYVINGKIRVTLYSKKGEVVGIKVLSGGDSILFVSEGHGVDFLKGSRIFEVKQGPYPGVVHAKLYFDKKHR